jgi:uncharacterized protein with PIN domain
MNNFEPKDLPQPPYSDSKRCPRCAKEHQRRTHERDTRYGIHFTLCRCLECWAVYWAADVNDLPIE